MPSCVARALCGCEKLALSLSASICSLGTQLQFPVLPGWCASLLHWQLLRKMLITGISYKEKTVRPKPLRFVALLLAHSRAWSTSESLHHLINECNISVEGELHFANVKFYWKNPYSVNALVEIPHCQIQSGSRDKGALEVPGEALEATHIVTPSNGSLEDKNLWVAYSCRWIWPHCWKVSKCLNTLGCLRFEEGTSTSHCLAVSYPSPRKWAQAPEEWAGPVIPNLQL